MKMASFVPRASLTEKIKLLFLVSAVFAATASSSAVATTITNEVWTGANNFNGSVSSGSPNITPADSTSWNPGFYANELLGISGSAMFEAKSSSKLTTFDFWAFVSQTSAGPATWTLEYHWTSNNTNEQSLSQYFTSGSPTTTPPGPVVPLLLIPAGFIHGVAFTSVPTGSSSDPTFSSFLFQGYLGEHDYYDQHKSYYDSKGYSYDDYTKCGDYENYLKTVTTFEFADTTSTSLVGGTPLPAALPLFASGTGLLGFLGWRRKKRISQLAA